MDYHAIDNSGDAPQQWQGTDAFTLVRHEGQWRIASLVFARTRSNAKCGAGGRGAPGTESDGERVREAGPERSRRAARYRASLPRTRGCRRCATGERTSRRADALRAQTRANRVAGLTCRS
jgi:hypothetical protein